MSTTTVALIVLMCTLLFGGVIVSRSYFEGFEVDASGNQIPSPNTPTNQPPVQVSAKPISDIMVPSMQMPMQNYGMTGVGMASPMQNYGATGVGMASPMQNYGTTPPMSLPIDAQILLPIQSPTFNRYRAASAMQLQGAPYGQMGQMGQMAPMAQIGPMVPNLSPEAMNQQAMLLDKSNQAAAMGDMAAAASLKQAASQIGRG
jgi:hypothetical protein